LKETIFEQKKNDFLKNGKCFIGFLAPARRDKLTGMSFSHARKRRKKNFFFRIKDQSLEIRGPIHQDFLKWEITMVMLLCQSTR
jgi:hypothetical protein